MMEEFKSLIHIIERLLGPDGCPWDREQTMQSMRHCLVEETYEVTEAIDLDDNREIEEEVGDLLFNAVFLCKLAEKEGRFNLKDALQHVNAKLVRRHPHVFGEGQLDSTEEVLKQWEQIKHVEKKGDRKSALDGIPKDLPALARAQKIGKKLAKLRFISQFNPESLTPEEKVGEFLLKIVQNIANQGIQAEQALRKRLVKLELEFRQWEQSTGS